METGLRHRQVLERPVCDRTLVGTGVFDVQTLLQSIYVGRILHAPCCLVLMFDQCLILCEKQTQQATIQATLFLSNSATAFVMKSRLSVLGLPLRQALQTRKRSTNANLPMRRRQNGELLMLRERHGLTKCPRS